tara:strand:+ start:1864 stop:2313 length:450 start_codon:yes stop_codon:yes gene_type:complete
MKIVCFTLLIFSISFSQNEIKHSDIIGEWEIKVKVKQLLKKEIKKLDMLEKLAAELAIGLAEDIIDSADMYIQFKKDNIAILTFDYLDFQEQEEIRWMLINNEILIDDSLNKRINIGSKNNTWVLENDLIYLKDQNHELNRGVFLKKIS